MKIIQTASVSASQKEDIFRLWNTSYPSTIIYSAIQQLDDYLAALTDVQHYFLMASENITAGWAITFRRNEEQWFAIIIAETFQGKGAGSLLLDHIKANETILNGWVIEDDTYIKTDGSSYRSPLEFYLKNGFILIENEKLVIPQMKAVKIIWKKANAPVLSEATKTR